MIKHSSSGRSRLLQVLAALGIGVTAALASAPAMAWHHGHWGPRVGIYVGPGYYGGYYPPPAYYYPPAPIVVQPAAPPVYIEQAPQAAAPAPAPAQSMWYYCAGSRSYYPYVKDCPGGWQQVAPRP